MATNDVNRGNLTGLQYVRLSEVISCTNMKSIALAYLDINMQRLRQLKEANKDDPQGFVMDVIDHWASRNPDNQVQNLTRLLYSAAGAGYVNPHDIKQILGVSSTSQTENNVPEVTLDELQAMADNMRPYVAEAMKIEVAPWIKDYVVDMDDLYTKLALEKIHNKPAGQDAQTLKHYKELFKPSVCVKSGCGSNLSNYDSSPSKRARTDCLCSSSDVPLDLSLCKGEKILMKGDPGMGKTTQCKKISWDWAKRLFTYFHMVFFVFLKLVKPGDVIEEVIIEQNPYIEGLEITEQKLRNVLQSLGSRCLLILDGLDEHPFGTNKDVLSIIRGKKYLKCNIIVTSRPHISREIEGYFPTVVRVEGFTRNKAKEFASKILNDDTVIEGILNYSPQNIKKKASSSEDPIHKCPILLSFLCLLAREDDIDLTNNKMHTGEIYARMVRCLYKKYAIRKGLSFDAAEFQATVPKIGRLALKTLLSGNPLLRRADVIKEVGPDAFDYGLLIGHEDAHRLLRFLTEVFKSF